MWRSRRDSRTRQSPSCKPWTEQSVWVGQVTAATKLSAVNAIAAGPIRTKGRTRWAKVSSSSSPPSRPAAPVCPAESDVPLGGADGVRSRRSAGFEVRALRVTEVLCALEPGAAGSPPYHGGAPAFSTRPFKPSVPAARGVGDRFWGRLEGASRHTRSRLRQHNRPFAGLL